jgi:hypothetical protein
MKKVVWMLWVVGVLLLNGCGNSTTPPQLNGNWAFTLKPSGTSNVIQFTATLTQVNNSLYGPVTLAGNAASCNEQAQISGSVSGNALNLEVTQYSNALDLQGTTTGGAPTTTAASGKYAASSGPCIQNGGSGTWSAVLEPNDSSSFEQRAR